MGNAKSKLKTGTKKKRRKPKEETVQEERGEILYSFDDSIVSDVQTKQHLLHTTESQTDKIKEREPSTLRKSVKHSKTIVAAIDFGTTFSGFAFCTLENYVQYDMPRIYANFVRGSGRYMSSKEPTAVLLTADGKLHSFGFEAEEKFMAPDQDNQFKDFYFFRQFKMSIFESQDLSRTTVLKDVRGKEFPAIKVFSVVIQYFKDGLLNNLKFRDTQCDLTGEDIHWVLTVPAIWNLKAKQFMREAANLACIPDEQLTLALEPEAASLYSRKEKVGIGSTKELQSFLPGSQYLVLDLGGGTVDMTAHEVLPKGGLRELHHSHGGYWGGSRVNERFMSFISSLFGADVRKYVETNFPADWFELIMEFERHKCSYKKDKNINIRVPHIFFESYETTTECSIQSAIPQTSFSGFVRVSSDKLHISNALFESFFEESINKIVEEVDNLLLSPSLEGVSSILMVGGYAESFLMANAIREHFTNKRVIIPLEPSVAVLKGAIVYGFEPDAIVSRVSRYTYGIAKQKVFNKLKDPPEKKRIQEGREYCDDAFDKHVEIGEIVEVGKFQEEKEYVLPVLNMTKACLEFYASTEKNPRFVDEKSCMMIGSILIDISQTTAETGGKIMVRISVGGTELLVQSREEKTGKVTNAYCNFLP